MTEHVLANDPEKIANKYKLTKYEQKAVLIMSGKGRMYSTKNWYKLMW